MRKKLLFIVFIILFSLVLTGCGKKEEKEKEERLPDDTVVLEGITYKLDQEDTGYGIKYKIASNFRRSDMVNAINYFSEKIGDSSYFVIRIYQYPNKDIEYAIKDSVDNVEKREIVTVGDKEYTKVYFTNYNGAKTHLYYYKYDKTVYTFVFTASIDLSRLEDIFLKGVVYEK